MWRSQLSEVLPHGEPAKRVQHAVSVRLKRAQPANCFMRRSMKEKIPPRKHQIQIAYNGALKFVFCGKLISLSCYSVERLHLVHSGSPKPQWRVTWRDAFCYPPPSAAQDTRPRASYGALHLAVVSS